MSHNTLAKDQNNMAEEKNRIAMNRALLISIFVRAQKKMIANLRFTR